MVSLITVHSSDRAVGKYKEILLLLAFFSLLPQVVFAQFVLDFSPKGSGVVRDDMARGGSWRLDSQTPFLSSGGINEEKPEIVTDPETGKTYYHMINGDPLDGFAQEVFIEIIGTTCWGRCRPASASGGAGGTVLFSGQHLDGNSHDPLDSSSAISTGNGSGAPDKVIIRQFLNDGDIFQEFLKDTDGRKPRITQMSFLPEMSMFFDLDMRNTDYTDNTTPGAMVNTLTFDAAAINLPESGLADFSMTRASDGTTTMRAGLAPEKQPDRIVNANVTGGQYTYDGAYHYIGDGEGIDLDNMNWEQFFDSSAGNIWTYGDNLPDGGVAIFD